MNEQHCRIDNPASVGVGKLLQKWRRTRAKSQLEFSLEAGVSTRHLSFIESGRSNPSRDMVLMLAEALDLPLRERNEMLNAAGYAPVYRETALTQPELSHVSQAVELILEHQKPFPAVVMDRHWNLMSANEPATRLFDHLLGGKSPPGPPNVIRLMFHPDGVRSSVENWEEVAGSLIQRMHREAVGGLLDENARALLDESLNFAGMSQRMLLSHAADPVSALLPIRFRKGDLAVNFFSAVTTLGTPRDITLQEMRIECFFPADAETRQAVKAGLLEPR